MSDPARFRKLDEIFAAALERPPTEREAFLDAACAGDADLRREAGRLLAADAGAGEFLERPATVPPGWASPEEPVPPAPRRLGPYLLLREIGSGGMGTVYLARRDDEHYERDVAIKILRSGSDDAEAVHRFFAERQILARLEHPGIARLYDGGSTEEGRPFLVMELVDGLPLDEYCDRHGLGIDARLEIFRKVCAAVQHAHQNLLVHRDLKPANILVTEGGEPKLLDFGIAKQLAGKEIAEDRDDLTRTGSRMMTPSYASPEQIKGEPVTTASDVYSLGVVLYELLTGRDPYRGPTGLPHEMARAICEQEPERPSQALFRHGKDGAPVEEIARVRATRPEALRRKLRGDLDTIVLTALRKEPSLRYGTAAELAADLESHRRHEPVAARPDSLLYRTRKLIRRRRGAVAAAAAAVLVLIAFVVGLAAQGRRLAEERDKARYALSFLVDTFREADPYRRQGERLSAEQILDRGAARVSRELAGRPDVQAAVMDAIGEAQLGLGRADAALPLLTRAVALRRKTAAAHPLDLAASLEHLASARYEKSELAPAEALLEEAVALRRRSGSDPLELAAALNKLGMTIAVREPSERVAALHREALALARKSEGATGPTVAETLLLMGRLAHDQGDYARAERLYRQGLAIQRKVLPPGDPTALRDLADLSVILLDAGKPKEAEALLVESLEAQRRVFGKDHPDLFSTLNNLGKARSDLGDPAGAETAYREALALQQAPDSESDLQRASVLGNLGLILQREGRLDDSAPLFTEALELRRRRLGDRHPLVGQLLLHLARSERLRGHFAPGLDLARQSLAIVEESEGPDHPHVAFPLREIASNYMAQHDAAAAEPPLRRALDLRVRSLPAEHPDVAQAQLSLATCLLERGKKTEAETLLRAGRATLLAQFGPDHESVKKADEQLAALERERRPH
jgi:serine/threonine-protein kinase